MSNNLKIKKMSEFKDYPIYKKRNGQSFERVSHIFSDSFDNAKKQFAHDMVKDNHNLSNNIVWLDKEKDKVPQTGWYDLSASIFGFTHPDLGDETEGEPVFKDAVHLELICSEEELKEGFDSWVEDVYCWELRDVLEEVEL